MKIAIIGGAGFIGTHLTKAYLDAGHHVLVIDTLVHSLPQAIDARARFYHVDVRDEKLRHILQRERPNIVSHHATRPLTQSGEQTLADADIHVRGLLNVLHGCVEAMVQRFIFASGGNTLYGTIPREFLPLNESCFLYPGNAHDIHKVTGEWYVRYYTQQYRLNHTILRYADVYGDISERPAAHPLRSIITMLHTQRRPVIRGTGEEISDTIFIDDVVQANLSLLTHGENQTVHISSGQGCTLNHLYRLAAYQLGSTLEPLYLPALQARATAIVLDNSLARRILGWQPAVNLEEGIRHMIERMAHKQAYQENPCEKEYEPVTDKLIITPEASLSRI